MSRGSKSAEKHQPYSRKDGPAQQQRANDDDAGGEKKKQKKSNRKRNKEIAFSFHSSWTHPNLFGRTGRPIFSHDKSAVERMAKVSKTTPRNRERSAGRIMHASAGPHLRA